MFPGFAREQPTNIRNCSADQCHLFDNIVNTQFDKGDHYETKCVQDKYIANVFSSYNDGRSTGICTIRSCAGGGKTIIGTQGTLGGPGPIINGPVQCIFSIMKHYKKVTNPDGTYACNEQGMFIDGGNLPCGLSISVLL